MTEEDRAIGIVWATRMAERTCTLQLSCDVFETPPVEGYRTYRAGTPRAWMVVKVPIPWWLAKLWRTR